MTYVHGYSERETQRLYEPARILEDILYTGTGFPAKARVLEAGCGVGGQTRLLTKRSPGAVFTCIDISEESLATANRLKEQAGFNNVTFRREDITRLSFADETFDHIIVPMVQSAEHQILADDLVPKEVYERGIADLSRVAQIDEGTFFYTWLKAVGKKR